MELRTKQNPAKKNNPLLVLTMLSVLVICQPVLAQEVIPLSNNRSTSLYGIKAKEKRGGVKVVKGNFLSWRGNAELVWDIDVSQEDDYEVVLVAEVCEEAAGCLLSVKTAAKIDAFELSPTPGSSESWMNFHRIPLGSVSFKKGRQKVSIATEGVASNEPLLSFHALELVPVSAKPAIVANQSRALEARPSLDWFQEAGYGVMFHWTSRSVQPDGSHQPFEEAVNAFDVSRFANRVEEMGAGYVIFTVGHAEQYCPAPVASWEKLHPGKTTQRDLIAELAEALDAKGIRLMCYMHLTGLGRVGRNNSQTSVDHLISVLTEFGDRYEKKVAGYWFDCCYQLVAAIPDFPFEEFDKAVKTGNEERIFCLNSWGYPSVSPWQDYWAGEVQDPVELPSKGAMKNGPVPDLPYQVLLTMEPYLWVQKKAEASDPKFTSEELSRYIADCMNNKGVVTINLGIYQDGSVGEKSLLVMKGVKHRIRK